MILQSKLVKLATISLCAGAMAYSSPGNSSLKTFDVAGHAASSQPAGTTAGTNTLTSGVPTTFTMAPVPGGALFAGPNGFSINVPQGASKLEVSVRTSTPN